MEEKIKKGCTFYKEIDKCLYKGYITTWSHIPVDKDGYSRIGSIKNYAILHLRRVEKKYFNFILFKIPSEKTIWYHEYTIGEKFSKFPGYKFESEMIGEDEYFNINDVSNWVLKAIKNKEEKVETEKEEIKKKNNIKHKINL